MKAIKKVLGFVLAALMAVGVIYTPGLGTKEVSAINITDGLYMTMNMSYTSDNTAVTISSTQDWVQSYVYLYNQVGEVRLVFRVLDNDVPHYITQEDIDNNDFTFSSGVSISANEYYHFEDNGLTGTVWEVSFNEGPKDYKFAYKGSDITFRLTNPVFGFYKDASGGYSNLYSKRNDTIVSYEGLSDVYILYDEEYTFSSTKIWFDGLGCSDIDPVDLDINNCPIFTFEKITGGYKLTPKSEWPSQYKSYDIVLSFGYMGYGYSLRVTNNSPLVAVYDKEHNVIESESDNYEYTMYFDDKDAFDIMLDQWNTNYPNAEFEDLDFVIYVGEGPKSVKEEIGKFMSVNTLYSQDTKRVKGYSIAFNYDWPSDDEYINAMNFYIVAKTKNANDAEVRILMKRTYPECGVYNQGKLYSNLYGKDIMNSSYEITYYQGRQFSIITDNNGKTTNEIITIRAYYLNPSDAAYTNQLNLDDVLTLMQVKIDDGFRYNVELKKWPDSIKNENSICLMIDYTSNDGSTVQAKSESIIISKPLYGTKGCLDDSIMFETYWNLDTEILNAENSYIEVKIGDTVEEYAVQSMNTYKPYATKACEELDIRLASAQVNDNITMTLYFRGSEIGTYNLSFSEYAKYIRANSNDKKLNNLVDALLNYSDYSRKYFNYNLEGDYNNVYAPVEGATVTDVMAQYTAEVVKADIEKKYANNEGFITSTKVSDYADILGISLTCRDRVSYNLYLETKGDKGTGDIYALCPENAGINVIKSNICKVTLANIPVWSLGTVQTIKINTGDGEGSEAFEDYVVNPMEYIYLSMDSKNESLVNLSRAMYIYYLAGTEYMKDSAKDDFESEIIGK